MRNFRNGREDVGSPMHHADTRPRFTGLRMGDTMTVFGPGPTMVTAYVTDDVPVGIVGHFTKQVAKHALAAPVNEPKGTLRLVQ